MASLHEARAGWKPAEPWAEAHRYHLDLAPRGTTGIAQIDPKEKIVAVALVQPFPFNEHNLGAS